MAGNFGGRAARTLRVALALVAVVAAFGPVSAEAFTLINTVTTKLFWNPAIGYTTSYVQVRATAEISGACPTTTALTFNFYFDAPALWSKTVGGCNTSTGKWDTGFSAYIKPPSLSVGTHVISVKVINPATGGQVGAAQGAYKIVQAPASPRQQTSPSQISSPSEAATTPPASPTSTACPAGAMLPPAGTGSFGDTLVAGLVMSAVLPILGVALFGPGPLLAAVRRRRSLLMLLGLSTLAFLTISCASTVAEQPTPAALVSPAASPSCSA